jgi:hypothetical protein
MLHALLAGEALGCGSQCVATVNKILKKWLVRFVVGQQIFKACCAA